jgi:hypothetical protein
VARNNPGAKLKLAASCVLNHAPGVPTQRWGFRWPVCHPPGEHAASGFGVTWGTLWFFFLLRCFPIFGPSEHRCLAMCLLQLCTLSRSLTVCIAGPWLKPRRSRWPHGSHRTLSVYVVLQCSGGCTLVQLPHPRCSPHCPSKLRSHLPSSALILMFLGSDLAYSLRPQACAFFFGSTQD